MNKLSLIQQIQRFFKLESAGGILLLFSAVIAMLLANSPLNQTYNDFLNLPVSIQVGSFSIDKTLIHWINDGFMAVFFVLVGMEVKRELFEGSLSSYQQAVFPAIAAVGGMVIPALVYIFIAQQDPTLADGWAIPMATDIAFALGIMALLSKQVPLPLKIFLLALAIIDDLGAIVVIALFFSHGLSVQALVFAAIAIAVLIALNRFKVTALCAYMLVGTILWASVLKSGVHATLAGVIIGFCIPLKGKKIFVTVDLDVLDPSVMPGTGTPESGGMQFNELMGWFEYLKNFDIVGADVVELAPDYDASGVSTAVATKVIRELLMIM